LDNDYEPLNEVKYFTLQEIKDLELKTNYFLSSDDEKYFSLQEIENIKNNLFITIEEYEKLMQCDHGFDESDEYYMKFNFIESIMDCGVEDCIHSDEILTKQLEETKFIISLSHFEINTKIIPNINFVSKDKINWSILDL
jgi:hypothetical protein